MVKVNFKNIEIGLTLEDIKKLHERALHLIKKVGIKVPHKNILSLISEYKGVTIKNSFVCFSEELVEKAIKKVKYIYPKEFKNKYFILSGAYEDKSPCLFEPSL